MKFREFLNENKKRRLVNKVKSKMNKEISAFLKQTYFEEIPLKDLFDILKKYDIVPIQEDNRYWDGMLTGGVKDTAQVYFDLAWKDSKEGNRYTEEVPNANLAMSYYKMPRKGKYEIIAYIT